MRCINIDFVMYIALDIILFSFPSNIIFFSLFFCFFLKGQQWKLLFHGTLAQLPVPYNNCNGLLQNLPQPTLFDDRWRVKIESVHVYSEYNQFLYIGINVAPEIMQGVNLIAPTGYIDPADYMSVKPGIYDTVCVYVLDENKQPFSESVIMDLVLHFERI